MVGLAVREADDPEAGRLEGLHLAGRPVAVVLAASEVARLDAVALAGLAVLVVMVSAILGQGWGAGARARTRAAPSKVPITR